jgi:hypothetical protein
VITQDKNHITRNKNHIPPPRKPRRFSRQSYRSLTGKRQRHSEHITCRRPLQFVVDVVFKCLRQRSNGQQYFTCMCFLGFIRYNKTFIACGFRKYENLYSPTSIIFPSGNALREYDTLGWINFHISLPSMQ